MHSSIPSSPQLLLQKSISLLWTHKPALDVSDSPAPLKWPQVPHVVDKIWPSESVEMLERAHITL